MRLRVTAGGFALAHDDDVLLAHSPGAPMVSVGAGHARYDMRQGNFDISDALTEQVGLAHLDVVERPDSWHLAWRDTPGGKVRLAARLVLAADDAVLHFEAPDASVNRVWLRLPAESTEHVWGCGEQMSYLDLRGRRFPLWTSEPGVGRDKSTEITALADAAGGAGGDYYTTNYPQPTYLSSRRYAAHVETTAWSAFDFRDTAFHELEVWAVPARLELFARPDLPALVSALAARFGKPAPLPDWVRHGAILGLKDGARSLARLQTVLDAGARVAGLWCEDWSGIRQTSFGRRLFWDWVWSPERYPGLDRIIPELRARGLRFLGYVNPYLCTDGTLFPEAERLGHFARTASGETYLVDFGEFHCGVLDLTSAAACGWFAERVIGRNMLDFGLAGWMADFGEYLPVDVVLADGRPGTLAHNAWPTLWAALNARAVAEAGREAETVWFMRAGYTGVQAHCPLLWAGDQCVDFSRHDGLVSALCGALSSGLVGNRFHHSDIGGYTSLFGQVRTAELLMRWSEMAAFTPVMRSHESNRPEDNLQLDQDPAVLAHFARMTRIFAALAPYGRHVASEAAALGLPAQRPLFLHFEADPATLSLQESYLLGADLLVAPVHRAEATRWRCYLPRSAGWVHLWSGEAHVGGGTVEVEAPLGQPPVFFRAESAFRGVFEGLRQVA